METGGEQGMRTLEQELAALVARGVVAADAARRVAHHPANLEEWLRRRRPRGM
jgi:Tfp pilus assembly pilus retraction ATPase PilT